MSFGMLAIAIIVVVSLLMAVAVGLVLFIVLMGRKSNPPSNDNDD